MTLRMAKNTTARDIIHSPRLRWAAYALTAVALAAAAYLAVQDSLRNAAIMAAFVIVSIAFSTWEKRLPSLFTFLFTAVAVLNAAGYIFDLWEQPVWFDEFVHLVTPFVLVAALAWLLIQRNDIDPEENGLVYFLKVGLMGLIIGFAWEGFEYVAQIIGDRADTISDLIMDTIGSLLAAAFCLWAARNAAPELRGEDPAL